MVVIGVLISHVPLAIQIHHGLGVRLGNDLRHVGVGIHAELEIKVVGRLLCVGLTIDALRVNFNLYVVVLSVHNLSCQVQERADEDGPFERDVVNHADSRRLFAVHASVYPSELVGLAHQEAAEDFVVQVSLLLVVQVSQMSMI